MVAIVYSFQGDNSENAEHQSCNMIEPDIFDKNYTVPYIRFIPSRKTIASYFAGHVSFGHEDEHWIIYTCNGVVKIKLKDGLWTMLSSTPEARYSALRILE